MSDHDFKDSWPEMRMKHLELIQSVIARMANNSANLKNYCMTLIAAVIGLAAAVQKPQVLLYAMPVVFVFSIWDANYLRLERAFRDQYNSIRKEKITSQPDFLISPSWTVASSWRSIYLSWSVAGFYWPMIILLGVAYYLI